VASSSIRVAPTTVGSGVFAATGLGFAAAGFSSVAAAGFAGAVGFSGTEGAGVGTLVRGAGLGAAGAATGADTGAAALRAGSDAEVTLGWLLGWLGQSSMPIKMTVSPPKARYQAEEAPQASGEAKRCVIASRFADRAITISA